MTTDNYKKHTSKNPIQKKLIENFFSTLVNLTRNLDTKRILDVGCGEGFTLERFHKEHIGKTLEGIDFFTTAVKLGEKQFPYLTLREGSIYDLPYKDNAFDFVLCTEVLEHLKEPEKALEELRRVTSKYLLLSVPNEPIFMLSNLIRGKNLSRFGNDIEHINHWSTFRFRKMVKSHGLSLVNTKHPFPWTMLLVEKVYSPVA